MSNHTNWYRRLVGNDTERTVALRSKITTSTLNRQLAKGELSMENVVAIARGYGENPISALVATEYITIFEARGDLGELVQLLPDKVLLRETARRIDDDPAAWVGTFDSADVRKSDQPVRSLEYVADDSDTEPEMGDEGYHDGP